jgi:AraC family transcriptional regulator, regulatory protein of adaptative response / methylated-DNA-[protein]-cysteine methyltransferase
MSKVLHPSEPSFPADYQRIARAIEFIVEHAGKQPSLAEIAAHVQLSQYHFQRLFSQWAGVTPKRFLQVLTLERAKTLLRESSSLLEVADAVGLSSGSRLYDHFVQLEAVTPGEFKTAGENVAIQYCVHPTPFGPVFIAKTQRGICRLAFLDKEDMAEQLEALKTQWPKAQIRQDSSVTAGIVDAIFLSGKSAQPLSLWVAGTNFQLSVWRALLRIPPGVLVSYNKIATAIGNPKAVRAVGSAVGANPVAFLIPCHRVIRQSGALGGYRWGETRKHALHAWESARIDRAE